MINIKLTTAVDIDTDSRNSKTTRHVAYVGTMKSKCPRNALPQVYII